MKAILYKAFFCILVISLPSLAYAAGVFEVTPADKSMQYLGMIFGPIGSLPITAEGTSLFSKIVYLFNQIIFALGIVIIIFTSFVGVINTAQEGEVLGKKWSSVIIPFRAGLGVYLLLPSISGYNWIQVGVMWFIIQGVGAANALWKQVIQSVENDGGIHEDTRKTDLQNAYTAVSSIFRNTLCMEVVNSNTEALLELNEPIQIFQQGDNIYFGRKSQPGEKPLCGSIEIPTITSSILKQGTETDSETRKQIMADAIMLAQRTLDTSALEVITTPEANWSLYNNFVIAARTLKAATNQLANTFPSIDKVNEEAITNGWIHAGSYYFQIASRGASAGVNVNISSQEYDADNLKDKIGKSLSKKVVDIVAGPGGRYEKTALNSIITLGVGDRAGGQMTINMPSSNKGPVQNILDKVFGSLFSDLASSVGKMITTNAGDPVISMANFGGNLATTIELLFWSALIAIFFVWLATSPMSCMQPLGHTMNFVLMIALPIISLCIMLLWAAGITMALYVPLIPYLVFTFSALSWVVLVIEAMLGAPLIALTLIVPSEDEIGKAGHAIIILLGLFLRPAMMILGFILATKFLIVAIGMLNFSFAATLKASISMGFGIFGFIALILVYTGLAVALVHEAFSLIYLLPDKTLRWMGGTPESTDVGQHVKGLEGSVDKGTGIGKGLMKGGLTKAQGMMRKGGGAAGGVGLK